MNNQTSPILAGFITYAVWIALAVAAGFVAWQWNGAILAAAAWVISKPNLRPVGWNSGTLIAVQRLAVLVIGSVWLIAVMYMENQLREATREGFFLKQTERFVLALTAAWLIALAIPLLLR